MPDRPRKLTERRTGPGGSPLLDRQRVRLQIRRACERLQSSDPLQQESGVILTANLLSADSGSLLLSEKRRLRDHLSRLVAAAHAGPWQTSDVPVMGVGEGDIDGR